MLAQVTHILGLTSIRRVRTLPVSGRVLVASRQKVNASDVIAEAQIPAQHVLVDVRRALRLGSVEQAQRVIVRNEGERVFAGDVIAETGGLFPRMVRAPADGQVVMIAGGRVIIEVQSQPIQIFAGVPGYVTEVIQERGAVIEGQGALIQGAWGNDRVAEGMMINLLNSPDEELTRQKMDVSLRGAVVVGGMCSDPEVLRMGEELPLRGLILSSMSASLVPVARSVNYPILLTEGFGRIPMNEAAYTLISTNDKRDVALSTPFRLQAGERPELIIPLPAVGEPAADFAYFKPDQKVRILGAPYPSHVGVLVRLLPGLTTLPNGVRAQAAEVRLSKDTLVVVPLANLEVIQSV